MLESEIQEGLGSMNFDLATLLGGATLVGVVTASVTAGWSRVRGWLSRIYSLVFVTIDVRDSLATALGAYCWQNMTASRFATRNFSSYFPYVKTRERTQLVGYEQIYGASLVFRQGWFRFISLTAGEKDGDHQTKATFIRGMFNVEQLLIKALDTYNENRAMLLTEEEKQCANKPSRFYVKRISGHRFDNRDGKDTASEAQPAIGRASGEEEFRLGNRKLLKWKIEELGHVFSRTKEPLDALWLAPKVREAVQEAIRWLESQDWYKERSIPWKRGWLLYGIPGTGKTSLIRALAETLDMPIFVYDLSTMDNNTLQMEWDKMMMELPCFALFEDLDAIFHKDQNMMKTDLNLGVTMDCLLQCLDGLDRSDGLFTIITTNRIEMIDPRIAQLQKDGMATRPGRIDRVLEMPSLGYEGRVMLANRILKDFGDSINEVMKEGVNDTGAQFQERCAMKALDLYWSDKDQRTVSDKDEARRQHVNV